MIKNGVSTISNMDKGFLYNLKSLTLDPQTLVNDYIKGKRKNILNPISFLIICVSVYLIADSFIDYSSCSEQENMEQIETKTIVVESGNMMHKYLKYLWIFSIIWLSVATKVFVGKYNFTEHLAINSFVLGFSTLLGCLIIFFWPVLIFNPVLYLSIFWLLYRIHIEKNKKADGILMSCGSIFFFIIILFIAMLSMGAIKVFVNSII